MIIDIEYNSRGQLKDPIMSCLHKLNQEMKKISNVYMVDVDNSVVFHSGKAKNVLGDNISIITDTKVNEILSGLFIGSFVEIFSHEIYDLMDKKKNKNKMVNVIIKEYYIGVRLDTGDEVQIGRAILPSTDRYNTIKKSTQKTMDVYGPIINNSKFIKLYENQVHEICEAILKCRMFDVPIYISKQLIPGIKSSSDIYIFVDDESNLDNKDIAMLYIKSEKNITNNIHVYKVVKY